MTDEMPERVWLDENKAVRSNALYVPVTEYLRADLHTTKVASLEAEIARHGCGCNPQTTTAAPVSNIDLHLIYSERITALESERDALKEKVAALEASIAQDAALAAKAYEDGDCPFCGRKSC